MSARSAPGCRSCLDPARRTARSGSRSPRTRRGTAAAACRRTRPLSRRPRSCRRLPRRQARAVTRARGQNGWHDCPPPPDGPPRRPGAGPDRLHRVGGLPRRAVDHHHGAPPRAAEASPSATASSTPSPTATTLPVPGPVSLQALMAKKYDGRKLRVGRVLDRTGAYTRYFVTYRSGNLAISGIMNVPTGKGPFPALVLNHGYIDPAIYTNGRGLMREQDYLARRGYVVLHTDYRNHAQSDDDPTAELELRLGYTEDVINAVLALSGRRCPYARHRADRAARAVDGRRRHVQRAGRAAGPGQGGRSVRAGELGRRGQLRPVDPRRRRRRRWPSRSSRVRRHPRSNPQFWRKPRRGALLRPGHRAGADPSRRPPTTPARSGWSRDDARGAEGRRGRTRR